MTLRLMRVDYLRGIWGGVLRNAPQILEGGERKQDDRTDYSQSGCNSGEVATETLCMGFG